jgi:hypothetical protein
MYFITFSVEAPNLFNITDTKFYWHMSQLGPDSYKNTNCENIKTC